MGRSSLSWITSEDNEEWGFCAIAAGKYIVKITCKWKDIIPF